MTHVLVATSPTIPDLIVFVTGALMVLLGAVGVITRANPVHAALSLVLTLFGVAVLFIEQQAEFLAVVQVIVYAGAIVVLFLFVIMFLGVDKSENLRTEPLTAQRPIALVLSIGAIASIIALGTEASWATGPPHLAGRTLGPYENVGQLGRSLFTTYLFAFEATAALLVIAVVGAVVLARRSGHATSDEQLPGASNPAEPSSIEGGAR